MINFDDANSEKLLPIFPMWNGHVIRFDPATERLSFTDMWKACGSEERNKPALWLGAKRIQEIAEEIAQDKKSHLEPGTEFKPYIAIHGGPNAGTWGCVELALAYAAHLDTKLWLWMLHSGLQSQTSPSASSSLPPPLASDLAVLMAKFDALAAQLAAPPSPALSIADLRRISGILSPRVAEIVAPRVADLVASQVAEIVANRIDEKVASRLLEVYQELGSGARERRASPVAPSSGAKPVRRRTPRDRAASEGFERLMDAAWTAGKTKPWRAGEIVALDKAGLFDSNTDRGRAKQFSATAALCGEKSFRVQDGAIAARLRSGVDRLGNFYWLEPEL